MLRSAEVIKEPEDNKPHENKERKFVRGVDNNIMLELIDTSMDEENEGLRCVNILSNTPNKFDTNVSYENVVVCNEYEDNHNHKRIHRVNINYFVPDEEHTIYTNPNYEFLKATQGRRNLYFQNDFRGIYRYKYEQIYSEELFKRNCCNYLFTPTNGNIDFFYERNTDKALSVNANLFTDVRVYDYLKSKEVGYDVAECKKTKFKANTTHIQEKYKVVRIPKDIMKIFAKITGNIAEAMEYLKLNEKSGYYCYHHESGVSIPVICKHQVMLLEGVNPITIANECYKNGVCKYCKQDMIAYNNIGTATLPPVVASMVISLAECFKEAFSVDTVIHVISNYISKQLENLGISVYSVNECIGYGDIFLLKIIALCKKTFKMIDYKVKLLINKISASLAFLGKSENDVAQILNNDEVFGDIESVVTILKSDLKKEESAGMILSAVIPEDVLFNSTTDRTPKTDLQKLYLSDKWKMYELFLLFEKEYNKLYNFEYGKRDLDDKIHIDYNTINMKINTIGYIFFQNMCKNYCPVNFVHEFKNDVCIHCSLDKHGKNAEKIYDKYSNIINNTATEEPKTLNLKDAKVKKADLKTIMDEIPSKDTEKLKEALHNSGLEYTEISIMESNYKTFNEKYFSELSIILNVDYEEFIKRIPKENIDVFVKKSFKYVVDKGIENEENMINIIYSCYSDFESSILFYVI